MHRLPPLASTADRSLPSTSGAIVVAMRAPTTTVPRLRLVLALLWVAGCGKTKAESCADVVPTPAGAVARECVHEVPNGAAVHVEDDGSTTVTLDGKVIATYPPCPCAGDGGGQIGGGEPPPPPCQAGCLCATAPASCPSGCYASYTAETDGGLDFEGCLNGGPLASPPPDDAGARCTYDHGGAPGTAADFNKGCPSAGCPAGTVCVGESGGVAGGGGAYCAAIPVECNGTPTCACMGACACRSGVGLRPEVCSDEGGGITCDNGVR
jgi:hypothetical protein